MYHYVTTLILLIFFNALPSFGEELSKEQIYIKLYASLAMEEMKNSKIPASITLAQGIHESNAGKSRLATEANNHFGIKCHKTWAGETIFHNDDMPNECFRKYETVAESYKDHSKFLSERSRYKPLFGLGITDYVNWAKGLQETGYATDQNYANFLINIIEAHDLTQYDDVILPKVYESTLTNVILICKKNIPQPMGYAGTQKRSSIGQIDEFLKGKTKNVDYTLNGKPAIEIDVEAITAIFEKQDVIVFDTRSLRKVLPFQSEKEIEFFFNKVLDEPIIIRNFSSNIRDREEVLKELKDTPIFCLSEESAKPYMNNPAERIAKNTTPMPQIVRQPIVKKPEQIRNKQYVSNTPKHQPERITKEMVRTSPKVATQNTTNSIASSTILPHSTNPAPLDKEEEKEMNEKNENNSIVDTPLKNMNKNHGIVNVADKNSPSTDSGATEILMNNQNQPKPPQKPEGLYDMKRLTESKLEKKKIILINDIPNVQYNESVSLMSIAMTYNKTVIKIMKYNDLANKIDVFPANVPIFLAPKNTKVKNGKKDHVVKKGETMWSLSQHYGVTLKSLLDKNLLREGEEPKIGEVILLKNTASKLPKLAK